MSRLKPENLVMLGDTPYDVQAAIGAHVNLVALLCGGWTIAELSGRSRSTTIPPICYAGTSFHHYL